MKYIKYFLLHLSFLCGYSQEYIKNRESYNLIGPVQSVYEERISLGPTGEVTAGGRRIENVTRDKTRLEFDNQGRMIFNEEVGYTKHFSTKVAYNNSGQMFKANIYRGLGGMIEINIGYNEVGKIAELTQTLNGNPAAFQRYTYDGNRAVELVFKDSLQRVGTHSTMRYNKNGKLEFETILWSGTSPTIGSKIRTTHEFLYNPSGKLYQVSEKDYDKNDLLISEDLMSYDDNEKLVKRISNTYNKNFNIAYKSERHYQMDQEVKWIVYDSTGNIITRSIKALNDKGFVTLSEFSQVSKGVLTMISSNYTKYDANNNLLEEKKNTHQGPGSGSVDTYTYKFDQHGNWIVKCVYANGHRDDAHIRKIQYSNGETSEATKEDAITSCK
jgi:hypothetical protein